VNAEIKAQWLAALRSGEYAQGYGHLRTDDEFCCLGVLCELHRKATDGNAWIDERYEGAFEVLPRVVVEWAGLQDSSPEICTTGYELAVYNDGNSHVDLSPHSFTEIADLIEEYL
jgi:hypothetical protein